MSTKSPIARQKGKKYAEKAALLQQNRYSVTEACALLPQVSTVKFDATVEAHIRINADVSQADQLVRTTVALPNGTGKNVRVAAFVPDDHVKEAKAAGAELAGKEDLIKAVEGGKIDFDVAVAMPEVMKDLGKIAKTLGQKGLMPNPKAGTVTKDITRTIQELKKGRIECKMDKQGIIHVPFGKVSFGAEKLQQNLETLIAALNEARPVGIKNEYILSLTVCPTMGPGIKVQL